MFFDLIPQFQDKQLSLSAMLCQKLDEETKFTHLIARLHFCQA